MKAIVLLLGIFALAGSASISAQEVVTPSIAPSPLGVAQSAIYRNFLASWNAGAKAQLNVANTTEPFSPPDDDLKGCLRGFPRTHTATVHTIPTQAFEGLNILLVDPRSHEKRDPGEAIRKGEPVDAAVNAGIAAGIFAFSEMVFSSDHTRAAFTYSFVCGGLCGTGGTIIFQHKNGKWFQQKHACGVWVS
jgi:hypothetical protein